MQQWESTEQDQSVGDHHVHHGAQDRLLTQSSVSGPLSVSYTYTANGEWQSKTVAGLPSPVSYS